MGSDWRLTNPKDLNKSGAAVAVKQNRSVILFVVHNYGHGGGLQQTSDLPATDLLPQDFHNLGNRSPFHFLRLGSLLTNEGFCESGGFHALKRLGRLHIPPYPQVIFQLRHCTAKGVTLYSETMTKELVATRDSWSVFSMAFFLILYTLEVLRKQEKSSYFPCDVQ